MKTVKANMGQLNSIIKKRGGKDKAAAFLHVSLRQLYLILNSGKATIQMASYINKRYLEVK